MTLREIITTEICDHGPIPFSRYMELCLYHPELGYYARPHEQFGKAGDFYTSSDVHAVFGRLLCRQFEEMWRALDSPQRLDLIELGPGRGLFARDVLDWAGKTFPDFARALRYRLIETSAHSRSRLQVRLADHIKAGRATVHAKLEDSAEQVSQNVIIFANEFFDALPVEIFTSEGSVRVASQEGKFIEAFTGHSPAELEYIDRFSVHPEPGQRVEVSLVAQDWMLRVASLFHERTGFVVFIDYGYTREEQLRGRHLDTLLTYRQHATGKDAYEAPGEQDITAHVNFTMLRSIAESQRLQFNALLTQAEFLMGIGEPNNFADAFSEARLPQEQAKIALQLKHLITPAGMGEIFQVLVMSAGVPNEKAAQLSGLKFAR
jgi:SAM-dependent MidA family methyltransferase